MNNNTKHLGSEGLVFLVYGYSNRLRMQIPKDITEIIRLYLWILPKYSMKCIVATHLITSIFNQFLTDPNNKCEFSMNEGNALNKYILKYIYVRGGAIRDCCLLRKIKDIDIIIDIHKLSLKYLSHLNKYHSKIQQQNQNCKCVFFHHYLNKFKPSDISQQTMSFHKIKNMTIDNKIFNFVWKILKSDFMLNSRFFMDILRNGLEQLKSGWFIDKKIGNHWNLQLYNYNYNGIYLNNISFDIVDGTEHSYGQFQTFKQYGKLFGVPSNNNLQSISSQIDKYCNSILNNDHTEMLKQISIPIYPFPINVLYYDFTINAMHIDLYSILLNTNNNNNIDFNWERKAITTKFDSKIVNRYNIIAYNDIHTKILRTPHIKVINSVTAEFYFWRLVKIVQKFINQLEKGIWTLDNKYLQTTIKHYKSWFIDDILYSHSYSKFIDKFLKWNIENKQDMINRLHAFRYIKFEQYFKKALIKYPEFGEKIKIEKSWSEIEIDCLSEYEYPVWRIVAIPNKPPLHCNYWIQHYQSKWLSHYNYFYNFYNKPPSKWNYWTHKKHCKRTKCKNRKKVKTYFKRKYDKQMNAKSAKKFKSRYALCLEY